MVLGNMNYKECFLIGILAYIACFIYYIDFSNEYPIMHTRGVDLFTYYGLEGEEHTFISEDGFQTKIHRLGHGGEGKQVLIFIPGLHCSSEVSFALGPDHEISYSFNRSGIDVWVTNYRGIMNTKPIADRNFTDDELTNFSFHEQGYYDLAAAIDYVRKETGAAKVSVIGPSLGALIMIALLSSRPEYNAKIDKMIFLGPTGPFSSFTNYVQPVVFNLMRFNKAISDYISTSFKYRSSICHLICTHPMSIVSCWKSIDIYLGFFSEGLPDTTSAVALQLMFTGPFFGVYDHLLQMSIAKKFVMRDFGKDVNLQKYGTEIPPHYNMTNVKVPVIIFDAEADSFLTPEGRELMIRLIPNIKKIIKVKPPFQHGNFVSNSVFAKEYVEDAIKVVLGKV